MNQCDQAHETRDEIRKLPVGGGGNVLFCKACFLEEMKDERWADVAKPHWEDLEVYQSRLLQWSAVVQETSTRCRQYTVLAATQGEAVQLMEAGETHREDDLKDKGEILDRTLVGGIRTS